MKFTKVFLSAMFSLLLFSGCTVNNKAIVTVNGEAITKGQYNEIMDLIKKNPQYKAAPEEQKKEDSPMMLMTRDRIVQDLITKTLLEQEFAKRNIKATNEEIEAKKQELINQIGSKERYQELLKQNGVAESKVKEDLANVIKVDKLVEAVANVKVSENEVKDYYNKNKAHFNFPQRVRASHILIQANPESIRKTIIDADKDGKLSAADIDKKIKEELDKKMALARDVREQALKNPKEFAALAKKYSDDKGSAQKGGDLGYFPKEAMVKEFADAAFSQKPGTISEIVVTPYGNHIILVVDRAAAGLAPLEQVQNDIKAMLEQNKKMSAMQALFTGLKASAKIEYNDPEYDPKNIQDKLKQPAENQTQNTQENK